MTTIDLHCHGAVGHAFDNADEAGVDAAVQFHRAHGSDAVMLSLVSAPVDQLASRLRQMQRVIPNVRGALGVHLEGPFLAPSRRGAHAPSALAMPTAEAVDALIDAGAGILRQVTLAPELPGAMQAIRTFVAAGIVVAVGHTEADYAISKEAFDSGARVLTHSFNAMPGLHHRDPGPVGAALTRDDVVLEVIADGVHLHPAVIRMLFAAAPRRIALVSDAMSATGLGDGNYELGGLPVSVREGIPHLRGTTTLAGSTLTLNRAIQTCKDAGVDAQLVLAAVESVPRTLLAA